MQLSIDNNDNSLDICSFDISTGQLTTKSMDRKGKYTSLFVLLIVLLTAINFPTYLKSCSKSTTLPRWRSVILNFFLYLQSLFLVIMGGICISNQLVYGQGSCYNPAFTAEIRRIKQAYILSTSKPASVTSPCLGEQIELSRPSTARVDPFAHVETSQPTGTSIIGHSTEPSTNTVNTVTEWISQKGQQIKSYLIPIISFSNRILAKFVFFMAWPITKIMQATFVVRSTIESIDQGLLGCLLVAIYMRSFLTANDNSEKLTGGVLKMSDAWIFCFLMSFKPRYRWSWLGLRVLMVVVVVVVGMQADSENCLVKAPSITSKVDAKSIFNGMSSDSLLFDNAEKVIVDYIPGSIDQSAALDPAYIIGQHWRDIARRLAINRASAVTQTTQTIASTSTVVVTLTSTSTSTTTITTTSAVELSATSSDLSRFETTSDSPLDYSATSLPEDTDDCQASQTYSSETSAHLDEEYVQEGNVCEKLLERCVDDNFGPLVAEKCIELYLFLCYTGERDQEGEA